MHSSSMRTARSPRQRPPWTETSWTETPPPPWTESPPGQRPLSCEQNDTQV